MSSGSQPTQVGAQPTQAGALAIVAALPRELALLSRDLRAATVRKQDGLLLQTASLPGSRASILLVTAGMGASRVSLAVSAALAHTPVDTLLSVGLAGACDPAISPGALVAASLVIDSRSGERFTASSTFADAIPGILVSTPDIAGPSEKLRLHATYHAAAVDMEAATVARLARAHDLRFAALKAISDEHDVDLTHLSPFATRHGHFHTRAFALHTALRPHRWRHAARLGRTSQRALATLTSALHQLVTQREVPPPDSP